MSQPTADEIQNRKEINTAFNTIMQLDEDALWTRIETEWATIKTTGESFMRTVQVKHLVQRINED